MDYDNLRKLNTSEKISQNYSLEELVNGAKEYQNISSELENKRITLEKQKNNLEMEILNIRSEMTRISFGGLLLRAIGLKTISEESKN